ncbi:S1C family serine protease [Terrilactibacillus laevilacticus]|uniref:S1C family serine protease n=1 Tax=Terrilactibacillus laevilacticus TaxID=1380157 RepID=A0ABW5PNV0_9BACI|nr:S1C family serine protease [Terrilactibacillus laevilacticus]
MDYFDDQNQNEEETRRDRLPTEDRREGRSGRKGWFFAGFLGAIIGIVVFLILAPVLSNLGVLPYSVTTGNGLDQVNSSSNANNAISRQLNVKVNSSVTDAVDKVSPSVVAVINYQRANFYDNQYTESGLGSGIIYKKANGYAYIVTNNHVVEGANKVEVRLENNKKVSATVLGKDSLYDLAVLRISDSGVNSVAEFGNSGILKRGEPAIAIGNPLGFSGSVTEGIVSSANRTMPIEGGNVSIEANLVQTDAAINPGNSGGALVNIAGQVIGINSSKIAEEQVEGIGFAIPINVAKPIINNLEKNGKIERPLLGVGIVDLTTIPSNQVSQLKLPSGVKNGLVISQIQQGQPAADSDLKIGDVITEINGEKIKDYVSFSTYLYTKLKPNQKVKIVYYRNGKKHTTYLTLGSKVFS